MKERVTVLALSVLMLSLPAVSAFAQAGAPPPPPMPGPIVPPTVPAIDPPVVSPPVAPSMEPQATAPADPKRESPKGTGSKGASPKAESESVSMLSLLGLGSDSALLQALNPGQSRDDDMSALLEKALKRIEADKDAEGSASGSANRPGAVSAPASAQAAAPVSRTPAPAEPTILRFLVNGYDILPTFGGPVIASRSGKGSFLITGDRFLVLAGRRRRETFYLLYRQDGSGRGRLYVDVSQEVANPESYLYRLSRRGPFKAERTGDLLVVRDPARDLALDLVFRLPDASGPETSGR